MIRVSAVVLRNDRDQVLTVRKRNTPRYMLLGDKPEAGEDAAQAAVRECYEEIGVRSQPERLAFLGTFRAPAANEPGLIVEGSIFTHPAVTAAVAQADIADLQWIDSERTTLDLAPLLRDEVLPRTAAL